MQFLLVVVEEVQMIEAELSQDRVPLEAAVAYVVEAAAVESFDAVTVVVLVLVPLVEEDTLADLVADVDIQMAVEHTKMKKDLM
jgi:hypothetical protein